MHTWNPSSQRRLRQTPAWVLGQSALYSRTLSQEYKAKELTITTNLVYKTVWLVNMRARIPKTMLQQLFTQLAYFILYWTLSREDLPYVGGCGTHMQIFSLIKMLLKFLNFYFICVHVCACLSICAPWDTGIQQWPKEGITPPGTGKTDSCEPLNVLGIQPARAASVITVEPSLGPHL